jgi:uncharacterized membrane protein
MKRAHMKPAVVIAINAILVLTILGIITATWLPAIYTSDWFQHNQWVRVHLLHDSEKR